MGRVRSIYRVMPTGVDVDMKALAEGCRQVIPTEAKLVGAQITDVAYGLKALKLALEMDDVGGVSEKIEKALAAVPHAESVEMVDSTLI